MVWGVPNTSPRTKAMMSSGASPGSHTRITEAPWANRPTAVAEPGKLLPCTLVARPTTVVLVRQVAVFSTSAASTPNAAWPGALGAACPARPAARGPAAETEPRRSARPGRRGCLAAGNPEDCRRRGRNARRGRVHVVQKQKRYEGHGDPIRRQPPHQTRRRGVNLLVHQHEFRARGEERPDLLHGHVEPGRAQHRAPGQR